MVKKTVIKKSALVPTALVAGGAGFIGSYLCESLLEKGARVVALDNFETGNDSYLKKFISNPNFALYNCDINVALPEDIESVDYVFHLAGLEEYLFSKSYIDLNLLLTNAVGTKNLLDLANKSNGKFVLVSSIDVYEGRMSQLGLAEYFGKTKFEDARYMVAEAKRYAEALVWEYFKKNSVDARIVRLPEIFGPRMNLESSGVLGSYISDMLGHRDITVVGDGAEKYYYLYITDAISGILKSVFNESTKGNIYSLVHREPISGLELAYMLRGLSDGSLQVRLTDSTPAQPVINGQRFLPDTFNLRELGWETKVSIKEGVIKSLESLGYNINTHSFKPGKLIEDYTATHNIPTPKTVSVPYSSSIEEMQPKDLPKETTPIQPIQKEETAKSQAPEALFSLQDVKPVEIPTSIKEEKLISKFPTSVPEKPAIATLTPEPTIASQVAIVEPRITDKRMGLPSKGINLLKPDFPHVVKFHFKLPTLKGLSIRLPAKAFYILYLLAVVIPLTAIFVGYPLFQTYTYAKKGATYIKQIADLGAQIDSTGIRDTSKNAYDYFYKAKVSLSKLEWLFGLVGQTSTFNSYDNMLGSLAYFSKSGYNLSKAVKPLENLWDVLRPDTNTTIEAATFEDAKVQIMTAKSNLQMAQADFKHVNASVFPSEVSNLIPQYSKALSFSGNIMDMAVPVVSALPEILGATTPKKYLILFQNSNEIRPTGGFIGSYGLLTLDSGKIKNLQIDDIYNPDGQIDIRKINVESPSIIKTYLNEDTLHLRNANWNPDFPSSAKTIEDLFFKINGDKIDGIIAIDLEVVRGLLRVTGPVFLTAYNEEINADNLFERAEMHSEFNYKEGSDQKRSFLTVLGSKLLERIFSLKREQLPDLIKQMTESLNQRHLMVYLTNSTLANNLRTNKWDGAFVNTDGDYLSVINANLGGTKANYFVKNSMKYEVASLTRDGVMRGKVTLTYTHTGKDNAWPSGPYKNFVRVFSKNGAKLTGATLKVNDEVEKDVFKDVVVDPSGEFISFGYGIEVQPTQIVTLTYMYDLPSEFNLSGDSKEYSLYWQKQAGTDGDTYNFSFKGPFGLVPSSMSANLIQDKDLFLNEGTMNADNAFYVKLQ